jgi:hypothetical protein
VDRKDKWMDSFHIYVPDAYLLTWSDVEIATGPVMLSRQDKAIEPTSILKRLSLGRIYLVPKYLKFDFFNINFNFLYYLKYFKNIIYFIM